MKRGACSALQSAFATWRRDAGGAAAVEFAIVVIPMLALMLGAIEYGRLMWTRAALERTAAATARCMGLKQAPCATNGAYDAVRAATYIQAQASSWALRIGAANYTLTSNTTCSGVANFAQVAINYQFRSVVAPLVGAPASGYPLIARACFPNQAS